MRRRRTWSWTSWLRLSYFVSPGRRKMRRKSTRGWTSWLRLSYSASPGRIEATLTGWIHVGLTSTILSQTAPPFLSAPFHSMGGGTGLLRQGLSLILCP